MQLVYTASGLPEAHIVLHMLTEARIDGDVMNASAGGALGELPVTWPEVWIRHKRDLDRALLIVRTYEESRSKVDDVCNCASCGEPNPGTFELCWQCQEPLDQDLIRAT